MASLGVQQCPTISSRAASNVYRVRVGWSPVEAPSPWLRKAVAGDIQLTLCAVDALLLLRLTVPSFTRRALLLMRNCGTYVARGTTHGHRCVTCVVLPAMLWVPSASRRFRGRRFMPIDGAPTGSRLEARGVVMTLWRCRAAAACAGVRVRIGVHPRVHGSERVDATSAQPPDAMTQRDAKAVHTNVNGLNAP
eukprot:scaffold3607_cov114-Isochrysis_galbana.AAC.20